MSGGHFDYNQYRIREIADSVERLIEKNGKKVDDELIKENQRWYGDDFYERHPNELYHHKYNDEVIDKFKEGLDILRKAEVYAQRIDWLVSGDDGEESFLERLKEDLDEYENQITKTN